MASNGIRMALQISPLQCRQVGAGNMERYNQFIEASRSSLGVVLGELVDVAVWGIILCVCKIAVGLSCGDVDSCQDDPQYKVMKYLVFGTILSSLLSELQIIIPKTDRNCVWSGMVNMQGGGFVGRVTDGK